MSEARSSSFSAVQAISAVVLLLVGGVLNAGCGHCARLADDVRAAVVASLGHVGAGGVVDAGHGDHIRVILDESTVSAITESLLDEDIFTEQRQGVWLEDRDGERVAVQVTLTPQLSAITLPNNTVEGALDLQLDLATRVSLDAPGIERDARFSTVGVATVRAAVEFVEDDDDTRVVLDLAESELLAIDLVTAIIPDDVLPTVEPVFAELLAEALRDAARQIDLWRVQSLSSDLGDVLLRPTRFVVDAETRVVLVGVVTNLRPRGELGPIRSVLPDNANVRIELHPGLVEAASQLFLVSGAIERRYTPEATASLDGEHTITLGSVDVEQDALRVGFRLWCAQAPTCFEAAFAATVPMAQRDTRYGMIGRPSVELVESDGRVPRGTSDAWAESGFLRTLAGVAIELIGHRPLAGADAEPFDLELATFVVDDDRLTLDATVSLPSTGQRAP